MMSVLGKYNMDTDLGQKKKKHMVKVKVRLSNKNTATKKVNLIFV